MRVNLGQTSTGIMFNFCCYGELNRGTKLLLKGSKVNQEYKFVCPSGTVRIAYNSYDDIFDVDDDGKMLDPGYPKSISDIKPAEILYPFLAVQNLTPVWTNCNGDYGTFNQTTKIWTGIVAEVIMQLKMIRILFLSIVGGV